MGGGELAGDPSDLLSDLSATGMGSLVPAMQGKQPGDRSVEDQNATMTLWAKAPAAQR